MDKQQKEQKKSELTNQLESRIVFLQQQIAKITKEKDEEIKKLQDEIDVLEMQSAALSSFKIK